MALKRKIEYYKFDGDENIKTIQKELEKIVKNKNYYENYSVEDIDFYYFNIFENQEEAMEMIGRLDNGDYHQLAVRYREEKEHPAFNFPKMQELKREKESLLETLKNTEERASIKNFTSKFRKCRGCESMLARELIKGELCPLCGTDLRGNYHVKTIMTLKKKLEDIDGKIERFLNRYKIDDPEYEVKWLVKIEYIVEGEDGN